MWTEYKPEGEYISIDRWGKDHWSTLAYLETCAVDNRGLIDNRRMRTHPRLHRELVGITFGEIQDGSQYPTRLREGELEKHDDWSCLEDMVANKLCRAFFREKYDRPFGGNESRVEFTELGLKVAAELRAYKASGGKFSDFFYLPDVKLV